MPLPFVNGQIPTATDFNLLAVKSDLAASSGAGMVGANAYQTQDDVNKEHVSVKRYGVKGDGVTNDRAALASLFAAMPTSHFTIDFQNLPIYLGSITANQVNLFTFTNKSHITFKNVGVITADNNITGGSYPNWSTIFLFVDCTDLDIDINCLFSVFTTQSGLICPLEIQTTTSASNQRNYKIKSRLVNGHTPLLINRPPLDHIAPNAPLTNPPYASDIQVDLYGKDVNYGLLCNYNGTVVTGNVRTDRAVRSYFAVDTYGHNVKVVSNNHNKFTDNLIKSYWANVKNIILDYVGTNDTSIDGAILTLEFQNDAQNTSIKNINAKIVSDRVETSSNPSPITLSSQINSAGAVQTNTASVTDNISLDLILNQISGKDTIKVLSQPSAGGTVSLVGGGMACSDTNGLTFVRGAEFLSNNVGPFTNIPNGYLYFNLKSLSNLKTVYCELEVLSQMDSSALGGAYFKIYFTLSLSSTGAITPSALVVENQYLFGVAGGPSLVFGNPALYVLTAALSGSYWNGSNAMVNGKLRILGSTI